MRRENLIAYASSFVSFLLDDSADLNIDRIILFGSVARGDFNEESDIDLFIDTKKDIEREVNTLRTLFENSKIHKTWKLKGLKKELSIKVGEMSKWKLRDSVASDGIILYGKFNEVSKDVTHWTLLVPTFKKYKRSAQVKLWRKLYGYNQKVKGKEYSTEGILKSVGGKKIEGGFIVPSENRQSVLKFLNKEKVPYKIHELLSDSF